VLDNVDDSLPDDDFKREEYCIARKDKQKLYHWQTLQAAASQEENYKLVRYHPHVHNHLINLKSSALNKRQSVHYPNDTIEEYKETTQKLWKTAESLSLNRPDDIIERVKDNTLQLDGYIVNQQTIKKDYTKDTYSAIEKSFRPTDNEEQLVKGLAYSIGGLESKKKRGFIDEIVQGIDKRHKS